MSDHNYDCHCPPEEESTIKMEPGAEEGRNQDDPEVKSQKAPPPVPIKHNSLLGASSKEMTDKDSVLVSKSIRYQSITSCDSKMKDDNKRQNASELGEKNENKKQTAINLKGSERSSSPGTSKLATSINKLNSNDKMEAGVSGYCVTSSSETKHSEGEVAKDALRKALMKKILESESIKGTSGVDMSKSSDKNQLDGNKPVNPTTTRQIGRPTKIITVGYPGQTQVVKQVVYPENKMTFVPVQNNYSVLQNPLNRLICLHNIQAVQKGPTGSKTIPYQKLAFVAKPQCKPGEPRQIVPRESCSPLVNVSHQAIINDLRKKKVTPPNTAFLTVSQSGSSPNVANTVRPNNLVMSSPNNLVMSSPNNLVMSSPKPSSNILTEDRKKQQNMSQAQAEAPFNMFKSPVGSKALQSPMPLSQFDPIDPRGQVGDSPEGQPIPNPFMIQSDLQRIFDIACFKPLDNPLLGPLPIFQSPSNNISHEESQRTPNDLQTHPESIVKELISVKQKVTNAKADVKSANQCDAPLQGGCLDCKVPSKSKAKSILTNTQGLDNTEIKPVCSVSTNIKDEHCEAKSNSSECGENTKQKCTYKLNVHSEKNTGKSVLKSKKPIQLDSVMKVAMRNYDTYLHLTSASMGNFEAQNAKENAYQEDALQMVSDRSLYVWQLIEDMLPSDLMGL